MSENENENENGGREQSRDLKSKWRLIGWRVRCWSSVEMCFFLD